MSDHTSAADMLRLARALAAVCPSWLCQGEVAADACWQAAEASGKVQEQQAELADAYKRLSKTSEELLQASCSSTHIEGFASRDVTDAAQAGIQFNGQVTACRLSCALSQDVAYIFWLPGGPRLLCHLVSMQVLSVISRTPSMLLVPLAQANEQLQVVRESHAATSKEVSDAHRCVIVAFGQAHKC